MKTEIYKIIVSGALLLLLLLTVGRFAEAEPGDITLIWTLPETFADGTPMNSDDVTAYEILDENDAVIATRNESTTSHTFKNLGPESHCLRVRYRVTLGYQKATWSPLAPPACVPEDLEPLPLNVTAERE